MIAFLQGDIAHKSPTELWLNCSGVGYELKISVNTYSKIPEKGNIKLYTYQQVREDAHILFGFHDLQEKEIFKKLISVSGVGANTALLILSSMGPEQVVHVISNEDVDSLKRVKGIGAKTAERVIVDLKDKITQVLGNEGELAIFAGLDNTKRQEALTALEVLGFNRKQADKLLGKLISSQPEISVEELVKQALKNL